MKHPSLFIFTALIMFSCADPYIPQESESIIEKEQNPAAEGFNEADSDSAAITIADQVMEAMGGRKAWDEIETIDWTFFGRRKWHWNKLTGEADVLFLNDSTELHIDLNDMTGSVYLRNDPMLSEDSLASWMDYGKSLLINDSYWLVMPYKLKDTGVTLKYLRREKINEKIDSHVLELTFEKVGDTPENKYEVFVDVNSHLVNQWSFFSERSDTIPAFTNSWTDYKDYEGIMLSSYRGDKVLSGISARKKEGSEATH